MASSSSSAMVLNGLQSSLMASSSSSTPPSWKYRVFTSFHGPDVRKTFLSHLRRQFNYNGITMFDDQGIERGQTIASSSLTEAIRESRISIVVLSKNYASSSWCLDELLEILECKEAIGQIVMTVFYGVDPTDVRKQTGEFGRLFNETCARKTKEDRKRWSQALEDVGNIAGENFLNWDNEAKMIEKIARDVYDKLNATPSWDFGGMVGLETHLRGMEALLDLDYDEVKIVAITGPAGIGKTTIARALQSLFSNRFQLTCFVDNLSGSYYSGLDEYGLKLRLQEHLLSKVLNQDGMRICHLGAIKERLCDLKVLIILDDVNDVKQLEALANETTWFGPGSKIIVTTENKELLERHGINYMYHVGFPSDEEAFKILCRYAFRKSSPPHGFEELAIEVTKLCCNLPLGLRVVGSSLCGKTEDEWENMVRRLEANIDPHIVEVLRVGYESLDENEQTLFLHIAVFFNHKDGDLVKAMLADNNLDIEFGLKILVNRSLIYISTNGEIVMHRLLIQVGMQAIRRQEPWKRRILIDAQEICDVLENDTGTRALSGISFDTSGIKEVNISKRALRRMRNLRFLHIYKTRNDGNDRVHIPEEMEFPPRLRLLHWEAYPSKILPLNFCAQNLVELDMQNSQLEKLWEGTQPLTNLKKMDLSYSYHLKELPDLSTATNLERLALRNSKSLVELPSSISNLEKLEVLDTECSESLGSNITTETEKSTATTLNMRDQNDEGGINSQEMTSENECILVFSCDDNFDDVEELHFIQAILKELQEREVTPLTYDLLGRENLDQEMVHRSGVGILVVSNSFSRSRQSLDNLVTIMEHWKAKGLVIIPVYFKVTHSDICGFKGWSEAAFPQYQNSAESGRVHKWKAAMAEIASIIDRHEWTTETQDMLAEEVVRNACLKLYLKKSKNLVRILALLNQSQPLGADIVGIWGMAGIGKTSISREIFGNLAPQYDLCYFLQDFHRMSFEKGLRQMREDFYSKVFGEEKLTICASDVKPSFMRDWFKQKKILVVLDDVSNAEDAEAVVGGFSWFSHGHRIIITSRRKQILRQCKVKEPYEIQNLSDFESSRLCKLYLHRVSGVISEIMSCSSGIPLALKVLCSSVSESSSKKEHLRNLRRNPPIQVLEAFQRSFDELDENGKNIFLDLACFFRGENKDDVVRLLNACGFHTSVGICDLVDESLISIVDKRIEIPIPFQDIGRFIVHEEDEDPCERSRLWDSNDIADVLKHNSGTEAIEGIFMDVSDLTCELELSPTVFGKMYRLRLLKFYRSNSRKQCKINLPQGLDTFPDELRLLHWEKYPLKYLPQKFNPDNLVEINMPYSNMEKLWEGKKNLEKLKKIKVSHSRSLIDILMLSEALNLEDIDLEGCTSLVDISTSIPHCLKLVSLNMKDCYHLTSLPTMFDLTSLKLLNMSGCSELEEIQDFAPNLKELYLAGTAIRELPLSIENLTELGVLDLENCRVLQQLPFGIYNSRSIVELKLSGCISLERRGGKRKRLV